MSERSISFITLGCKLNYSESSSLARSFAQQGYVIAGRGKQADIYVVNSCAVTAAAEKKCRSAIRKVKKTNPHAVIAVTGCMSQLNPSGIAAMPEVDIVLGNTAKYHIAEALKKYEKNHQPLTEHSPIHKEMSFYPAWSSGERTRSFLKIQDGCDHFCTYCTIPLARGRSRSDTIENTLRLAKEVVAAGIKEIILTGVNIGEFGKNKGESLYELLQEMHSVKGLKRLRISSIEPELLKPAIVKLAAESNLIMPHFHIPLQAGSNNVLKDMRRPYSTELFKEITEYIRSLLPLACIAVDIIAGFPTEKDEDFEQGYTFIENIDLSYLHVFPFSPRPNTAASRIRSVYLPGALRQRADSLLSLSKQKQTSFYQMNKGRNAMVLFESSIKKGYISGFTENYLEVTTAYRKEYINRLVPAKLNNLNERGIFIIH